MHVMDKCTKHINRVELHPMSLVSFCSPGALLVHASPCGFDSRVGSGTALDLLSHVLRGDEVETLTSLGKWK